MSQAFHLSLNVSDLTRSVAFYRAAFGVEPTKSYADYAKFELAEPAVVLSLEPSRGVTAGAGTLNHLGIRVAEAQDIRAFYERLAAAGIELQWLSGVDCCYARQSKIVAHDPDGNLLEVYVVEADLEKPAGAAEASLAAAMAEPATPTEPAKAHTHMLGTACELPAAGSRLEQVNLRGSFNDPALWERRSELLTGAFAALQPGGELTLHLLIGDKALTQALPRLPAPAQHVAFVPQLSDVLTAAEQAGFVDLHLVRLSNAPVMAFDDVSMRELFLKGRKADDATAKGTGKPVLYKGPLKSLADDDGRSYRRGATVMLDDAAWERLRQSPHADSFAFLSVDNDSACKAPSA